MVKFKFFLIILLICFLTNNLYCQDVQKAILNPDTSKSSIKNGPQIIKKVELEFDLFKFMTCGINLSFHYYLSDKFAFRFHPMYLWFWHDDDQFISSNIGLKYNLFIKKKSRTYLIFETGYYNWKLKYNDKEKKSGGFDSQLGIGYQWIPYKNIGTSIEFTYSFVKKKKVILDDYYFYEDVGPVDGLSARVCLLF
jgi:hypothetical protein